METASNSFVEEPIGAALTRTALAALPRVRVAGLPDGMIGIMRRTVVEAGLDLHSVRRWLWTTTGFEAETYLRAVGGGGPLHPEPYFAVPVTALWPPR
jgi:hypothetical protein